uniref:Uncharacterized protein n=1 Tax=Anopheles quadriannulatus TaxID=34691 RepID=A0A182XRL4_ANOQN
MIAVDCTEPFSCRSATVKRNKERKSKTFNPSIIGITDPMIAFDRGIVNRLGAKHTKAVTSTLFTLERIRGEVFVTVPIITPGL